VALSDLRRVFVQCMKEVGAKLSKVIDYEVPNTTISTLQIAYDLYNDLNREEEIIEYNDSIIENPAFVPSGNTLKVLAE